jgi:fluoride exporter
VAARLGYHGRMIYLLIALGGAVGSVLRYVIGGVAGAAVERATHINFPWGTLIVNVVGCILIGLLWRAFMGDPREGQWRALLVVGFCGGFTTFSTFSNETVGFILGGEWVKASVYVLVSVIAGVAGTAIALKRS